MAFVAQGAVALVADLEAVAVIQAGAMGRPLHVAELDFVDPLDGLHIHREFYLQQPVQFMPVDPGHKVQPAAAGGQHNVLLERGILNPP